MVECDSVPEKCFIVVNQIGSTKGLIKVNHHLDFGFCNCSMLCCALLFADSSFAVVSVGKRELVALFCLSSWCFMIVVWLFLKMPWVCLQFCDCSIS